MNSQPSSVSTRSMVFDGGGAPATTMRTRPAPGHRHAALAPRAAAASSTAAITAGAQLKSVTPSASTRRRISSPSILRMMTWRTPIAVSA